MLYGWGAAKASFAGAISAETANGSASPTTAVTSANWWLDVETGNHWEAIESAYGTSSGSQNIDQSMLLGAIAYFSSVGVKTRRKANSKSFAVTEEPSDQRASGRR